MCLFKRLHRKLCRRTLPGLRKCILYLSSDALQSFSTAESCEMERLCLGAALFFQLPGCSLYARPSFPRHLAIFRTDVVGVRVFKIQRACHSLNMYTVWLRAEASQTTGGGKPAASKQIARSQGAQPEPSLSINIFLKLLLFGVASSDRSFKGSLLSARCNIRKKR